MFELSGKLSHGWIDRLPEHNTSRLLVMNQTFTSNIWPGSVNEIQTRSCAWLILLLYPITCSLNKAVGVICFILSWRFLMEQFSQQITYAEYIRKDYTVCISAWLWLQLNISFNYTLCSAVLKVSLITPFYLVTKSRITSAAKSKTKF